MRESMPAWKRALAVCCLMLVLAGCRAGDAPSRASAEAEDNETIGLSLYGLNYTDVPIGIFYVNGTWGGAVAPYAAGLKTAGSIGLPAKWRPGIKVKVQWQDDFLYAQDKNALTVTEVEVPRYGTIYSGYLLVAFLPGGKVKVYASGVGPGHKDAPDGLENAGEFCQRQPGCPEWYRSNEPPREGHY